MDDSTATAGNRHIFPLFFRCVALRSASKRAKKSTRFPTRLVTNLITRQPPEKTLNNQRFCDIFGRFGVKRAENFLRNINEQQKKYFWPVLSF